MDAPFAFVTVAVLVAFTTMAAIGFGGVILSLTLGALVLPIDQLLPLLVPVSCLVTGALVVRGWRQIDRRLLLGTLLPLMIPGAALGFALFQWASGAWLARAYGVLVVLLAAVELRRALAPAADGQAPAPLGRGAAAGWIGAAGVVQGVFASGGPLLVYAVSRMGLDKGAFRSTLSMVWLALNVGLTAAYLLNGRLSADALPRLAVLLPVAVLALALGEALHHRLDPRRFRVAVQALLLVAGGALLLK